MIHPHAPRPYRPKLDLPLESAAHPDAHRMNLALGKIAAVIVLPLVVWTGIACFVVPLFHPAVAPETAPQHIIHSHPTTELRPASGKDSGR